jgi:hypothetical protein
VITGSCASAGMATRVITAKLKTIRFVMNDSSPSKVPNLLTPQTIGHATPTAGFRVSPTVLKFRHVIKSACSRKF